ncbi:MAG: flagellar motor protein MotB [Geminicoccaceae bacterium]
MADQQPIIIKKVKKSGGHGAHGGAWKVAYADFVTAMMAFFLLLWLLNVTTDEQKLGLANYFLPTTALKSQSGSVGFSGGAALDQDGPLNHAPMSRPSLVFGLPPDEGDGESDGDSDGDGDFFDEIMDEVEKAEREELLEQAEQEEFERVKEQLREAVRNNPELTHLAENLEIDRTATGLRIQIKDQEQRSMFPLGSSVIYPYMTPLVEKIVEVIRGTEGRIAISGHTDSTPFRNSAGQDNWTLSSDRAQAARKALVTAGLDEARIARVVGKAATEPLLPDDPAAPTNRRISIIILSSRAEAADRPVQEAAAP